MQEPAGPSDAQAAYDRFWSGVPVDVRDGLDRMIEADGLLTEPFDAFDGEDRLSEAERDLDRLPVGYDDERFASLVADHLMVRPETFDDDALRRFRRDLAAFRSVWTVKPSRQTRDARARAPRRPGMRSRRPGCRTARRTAARAGPDDGEPGEPPAAARVPIGGAA